MPTVLRAGKPAICELVSIRAEKLSICPSRATIMPATIKRRNTEEFVLGVDGCRAGWVVARLDLQDAKLSLDILPDFADLLTKYATKAALIMIDMPVGLADFGRRACEGMARQLLKPHRHSSVFSSPRRPMLSFSTYAEANAWGKSLGPEGGGGLSKQAWMITQKIKEIDRLLTPEDQALVREAHPEVAFWRLNHESPCRHSKRTKPGAAERLALLKQNGLQSPNQEFDRLRAKFGAQAVAQDDVYDACVLSLTACAVLDETAVHLTDGARDQRGLKMEIWG